MFSFVASLAISNTISFQSISIIVAIMFCDFISNVSGDCTTFFSVNRSGILTTTNDLDTDSGEIRNNSGVCSFTVQVTW